MMDTSTLCAQPATAGAVRADASIARIDHACRQACAAIAPAWPLDRAIAVNPHWSRIGMPVRRVAARMAVLGGIAVFPSRSMQRDAWRTGRIVPADLDQALRQVTQAADAGLTPPQCVEALHAAPSVTQLPLLIDVLDNDPRRHTRLSWREAITHQVSQTCAAYFDAHQADWRPPHTSGLYAFWRDTLQHDHGIGLLMGLPGMGRAVGALPATARDAERWVLERLGLPAADCLALEDSANGLRAALAAGIPTVVTESAYTRGEDFSGALAVLPDLGDTPLSALKLMHQIKKS